MHVNANNYNFERKKLKRVKAWNNIAHIQNRGGEKI